MIVVVAKQPSPGCVKTRLCPPLTEEEAAQLAEEFLHDTIRTALIMHPEEVAIGFAPPESRVWFARQYPGLRLLEQGEGDLGERLERLVGAAFEGGAGRVVLVGTDVPALYPSHFHRAFECLQEGADVAIGPAEDGGYYLIALNRPIPELFRDIAWSTETVFRQTLQRAEGLGLKVCALRTERDIDTPEDYAWYRQKGGLISPPLEED